MCINKDLEAMIHERGVAMIPTVAEAIAERKEFEANLRHFIKTLTPAIGQSTTITLSNAVNDVLGGYDRQWLAHAAVVMEAILGGGPGQVFITPLPEDE